MANIEVERDAPPTPKLPVDESVKVPKQVQEARERAESFYTPSPAEQPAPEVAAAPPQPPQPEPQPQTASPKEDEQTWKQRYDGMRGKHQQVVGDLQRQLTEMGNELIRLQSQRPANGQAPPTFLTPEDEQNYGRDLIDFTQRAAQQAITPKLSALEQENERLRQMVAQQSHSTMTSFLDSQVPGWRQVYADPRFTQWLNLPDIYSGVLRKQMLTEAANTGNAARVAAFYRGFIQEEAATGQIESAPQQSTAPVRQAAIALESIATPGRARPAAGTPAPAGNGPVFTRAQVDRFYADVRRGAYNGREQQKMADEALIIAAGREGRVR
jgi:hypothetical protein